MSRRWNITRDGCRELKYPLRKVNKETGGGGWLWTGYTTTNGGWICRNNRLVTVDRFFYTYFKGVEPPPGARVLHSCRNNLCVNPDHLCLSHKRDEEEAGGE